MCLRWTLLSCPAMLALLLSIAFVPTASSQYPEGTFQFEVAPLDDSRVDVRVNAEATLNLVFRDLSRDSYITYLPAGTPVPPAAAFDHIVTWSVEPWVEDAGWYVVQPGSIITHPGETHIVPVIVRLTAAAAIANYRFNVTSIATTQDGAQYRSSVSLLAFSLGASSFGAQVSSSYDVKPGDVFDAPVRINNLALHPRAFDMRVTENACGMSVATTSGNLVTGKGSGDFTVSARAPENRPWYFSQLCQLTVEVSPSDDPSAVQTVYVDALVNGGYVNPVWVFWIIALIVVIILLILFIGRRKARIEEEILGKPQKPWTIPVEVLYLEALRAKDERAWYVVRNHLMVEEYRSSLLWYAAFKKATKGSRQKEALVLQQEKAYERWKAKWVKAIAKPIREADRFEAKLQRKLDRKAHKLDRKDARKVRRLTKKMAAAHGKQVERALEKWQRAARKAEKKGTPVPPRPVLADPDYPEEPDSRQFVLAEHKWARKAERFRARRVRQQGDLEVKFEKADARQLAKLRRKVQRLARKLDDPDFVAQHPLLQADS